MPIKPENMALYPGGSTKSPEWMAIRAFIRARAGDCCEECGVRNGAHGARSLLTDEWQDSADDLVTFALFDAETGATAYWYAAAIRIVCTVAHVDHDVTNNHETNLRFWCQRCHNRHDVKHRQARAAVTRRERAGWPDLLRRG